MKIANYFIRVILFILLSISYLVTLFPFCFAVADSIKENEELLLSREDLRITSFQEIDTSNEMIIWFFKYESQAAVGSRQALKIHISNQNAQIQDSQTSWHKETETDWWGQDEFSTDGQGVIQVITSITEKFLTICFQIDRKWSSDENLQLEKNILNEEAGPYELTAKVGQIFNNSRDFACDDSETSIGTKMETVASSNIPVNESVLSEELSQRIEPHQIPIDPFAYTINDDHSSFPTHSTQKFLGSGMAESEYIKNYDYSQESSSDLIDRYTVSNTEYSDFDKGYHEFGSGIHTKKSVKLLEEDPKKFQVTLDTIGDELQIKPIDIVLILDRSANMQNQQNGQSYWEQLQVKAREFIEAMMNTGLDVQVGIVDFFVKDEEEPTVNLTIMNHRPMREDLKGNIENYYHDDFFSNNVKRILDRNALTKDEPGMSLGTPVFLAIDAALCLLGRSEINSSRENATKIVCSITNGSPNLAPTSDYYNKNGEVLSVMESLQKLPLSAELSSYKSIYIEDPSYLIGDGKASTEIEMEATQAFLELRKRQNPNVKWYSLGFHENIQPDALVASLGSEGCYGIDELSRLVTSMEREGKSTTIQNADLCVPMSSFVTLHQGSVAVMPILINEENILLTDMQISDFDYHPVINDDGILLENISLGKVGQGRLGFRLTYEVSLKEAYRDGKFYPISELTYLINNRAGPDKENYCYPIPSIRDQNLTTINLELKLQIKDTNNGVAGTQFGIFHESQEEPLHESTISTAEGWFSFMDVKPGRYWLKEIKVSELFKPLEPLLIQVTDTGKIYVGEMPLLVIEKGLKPVRLKVENISGSKRLSGAQYLLCSKNSDFTAPLIESINDIGTHELTGIKADTYQLLETKPSLGFQRATGDGVLGVLEITPAGQISYQSELIQPVIKEEELVVLLPPIKNKLNSFFLTLLVQDEETLALSGAEFALYEQDPNSNLQASIYAKGISDNAGQVKFYTEGEILLQPGQIYYMKQVMAPWGYLKLSDTFKVMINEAGDVRLYYGDESISEVQYQFSLKEEEPNQLQLRIQQVLAKSLPKTGGAGKQSSYVGIAVVALLIGCCYLSNLIDSKQNIC